MGAGSKRGLLLAVVPLVAVGELIAAERQRRAVPTDADWRNAMAAASAQKRPGDVILVAPRWAQPLGGKGAFETAGGAAPVASSTTIVDLRTVARPDLETATRVLEVSIRGKDDPQVKGFRLVKTQSFGKVELRTLENPKPDKLLRDLVSEVDETTTATRVAPDGSVEPCRFESDVGARMPGLFSGPISARKRWLCPPFDPGWSWFGETVITDHDYVPRRCIMMHPTLSNSTLTFPPRPIGQRVVAYVGKHVFIEREKRLAPVHVRISVAGVEVAHAFHRDGDGWLRFEGSTAAYAGTSQPVKIELWAEGSPQFRLACVAAELRNP